ncbi:MAG: hypothetical protein ACPG52_00155 [Cognaticolwellia sp.]
MPTNKHKRKASTHAKSKTLKTTKPGLISTHPKLFIYLGMFFIALGAYLLAFESQRSAMFGLAMLCLIVGVATTIFANFALPKNN